MSITSRSSNEIINLGTNIQKVRQYKQYTVMHLSMLSKYDRACLSNLEKGFQNIEYNSMIRIARALDIAFPLLFSENLNSQIATSSFRPFYEDDFLLIFIGNFKRNMLMMGRDHSYVYIQSGIPEAMVSRIITRKEKNPTILTLVGMSQTCSSSLESMFMRNK